MPSRAVERPPPSWVARSPASSHPGPEGRPGRRSDVCSPIRSGSKPPGVGRCKTAGKRRCRTAGSGLHRLAGADNPVAEADNPVVGVENPAVGVGPGTPAVAVVVACREDKQSQLYFNGYIKRKQTRQSEIADPRSQ